MIQTALTAIITTILFISGCATYRPYAQNPFNPYAHVSHTKPVNTGKVSDSKAFRTGNLGLAATSRPIPGAIPHGAVIGIASALLLGSGNYKPLIAKHHNSIAPLMPVSEAKDEQAAQLKLGALVENAIIKSLQPTYQTRIEEYDDTDMFGNVLRVRWIRVNGPYCENWSCQVTGPIPTANALQWEGEMEKFKGRHDGKYYYQYSFNTNRGIAFVKITKEQNTHALLDGSRHRIEGAELPGFDYEQFYLRISENLPEWVGFYVNFTDRSQYGYLLTKGKKEDQTPKNSK